MKPIHSRPRRARVDRGLPLQRGGWIAPDARKPPGYDMIRWLQRSRKRGEWIGVVFLGDTTQDDRSNGIKSGAALVGHKPGSSYDDGCYPSARTVRTDRTPGIAIVLRYPRRLSASVGTAWSPSIPSPRASIPWNFWCRLWTTTWI